MNFLELNQDEILEDINKGQCPLNLFMSSVEEGMTTGEL